MSRKTPLGHVLGLGSAKSGSGHWWSQRMSAMALLPLGLWLVISIVCMAHEQQLTYNALQIWVSTPYNTMLLIATTLVMLYHSQLGVQVVIEDYTHGWSKVASLALQKFLHLALAVIGVYSILKISFGA